MKIMDIRDQLTNIRELLDVCRMALLMTDSGSMLSNMKISNVMYFHVILPLENIDQNLTKINEN